MRAGGRRGGKGGGGRAGTRPPSSGPKLGGITLTLSGEQVGDLLREVTGHDGTRGQLLGQLDELRIAVDEALLNAEHDKHGASVAGLRLLGVLCALAPAGSERGLLEIAAERRLSPGTAHRYAQTLVEVGLLEQPGRRRKYRIPPVTRHEGSAEA